MPKKKLLNVHRQKTRHGKLVWYYREGHGPRIRLPDEYGSQEFKDAHKRAVAGDTLPLDAIKTKSGSWAAMVGQYLQSRAFLSLAPATQKQRRKLLRDAARSAGDKPPQSVTEASIRKVMIERPPHAANNFLKALRGFYSWSHEVGLTPKKDNPTRDITPNRTKSDGWKVWTDGQIEQFRKVWGEGTMERLAFELLYHTGLRRSDIILLSAFHDHGKTFEIKTKKTGIVAIIPATPELRRWTNGANKQRYITNAGKPFSEPLFGKWFGDACTRANIPLGIRAHSLRKTAATKDAESGKSASWLMAKYGWTKLAEAERYTKHYDRREIIAGKVRDGAK